MEKRRKEKDEKKMSKLPTNPEEFKEWAKQTIPEESNWSEIETLKKDIQELPLIWMGKRFTVKVRHLGWGEGNQISEEVARELGADPSPIVYTRRKQELKIKHRVTEIAGKRMQDPHGNPMEEAWLGLPEDMGEEIRVMLFRNTGEISTQVLEGSKFKSIKAIRNFLDELIDEYGSVKPDGLEVKEGKLLKK